jgi:molybdopterin-guanine dinucleotide biosynthesis protein A
MLDKNLITGLILAGGRGTRMGNVDKGLQRLGDEPMVLRVIRRLAPQVGTLMINANRNQERYREFGVPVWPDELGEYPGPLAGFQAGLRHCQTPYLLTAPCDSPFLPRNLVERLASALEEHGADLAVAVTGEGESRQPHPVFCLLKSSLLPHLNQFLRSGKRRIDAWYASLKFVEVQFEEEAAFRNINTMEELLQSDVE